jgi:hypothetical protein
VLSFSDRDTADYIEALRHDPCAYCGIGHGVIDHIEAKTQGGVDGWENLTGACDHCNSSKHALSLLFYLGRKLVDSKLLPLLERRASWIGGDVRGDHFRDVRRWAQRRRAGF